MNSDIWIRCEHVSEIYSIKELKFALFAINEQCDSFSPCCVLPTAAAELKKLHPRSTLVEIVSTWREIIVHVPGAFTFTSLSLYLDQSQSVIFSF